MARLDCISIIFFLTCIEVSQIHVVHSDILRWSSVKNTESAYLRNVKDQQNLLSSQQSKSDGSSSTKKARNDYFRDILFRNIIEADSDLSSEYGLNDLPNLIENEFQKLRDHANGKQKSKSASINNDDDRSMVLDGKIEKSTDQSDHLLVDDIISEIEYDSDILLDENNVRRWTPSSTAEETIVLSIKTDKPVFIVEEQFLSFNIDFEMFYYDKDPWKRFNMTSPRLITILKGLAPAIWRIGGTDCAYTYFDVSERHLKQADLKPRSLVMSRELLSQFIKATEASGTRFLYDLNLQLRIGDQWNPENAIRMFEFLEKSGFGKNLDFELGNEPTGYPMSPERIADDFVILHQVIKSFPNLAGSRIVGPDSVGIDPGSKGWKVMQALANKTGDFIKAITFHQYYFRGTEVTYKGYIDPKYFPLLSRDILHVRSAVNSTIYPNTPIWIGETADGWNRGTYNVSDRYVSGFLWLDKLGLSARMGVGLVMRQTLRHGNYEMVGDFLVPNPDYWLSYVHKHLVGTRVLSVALNGTAFNVDPDPPTLQYTRVYAHCTKLSSDGITPSYPRGSVTIFGLNVSPNISKSLVLPSDWSKSPTDLYLLTPPKGDLLSQQVLLNDQILHLISDTQLPQLLPKTISPQQPFILPPLTFGFLVIPHANAEACL